MTFTTFAEHNAKPVAHTPTLDVRTLPLMDITDEDNCSSPLMRTLSRALSVKRGHGGTGEAEFAAWLTCRLPVTMIDGAGNLHIDTRTHPRHRTLLTAHLDTVHHEDGANRVRVDTVTEPGQTLWRADGAALGADDGAGVALIAHLISKDFKGYAILFRGEECGGIGSSWLADNMPELLTEFDRAVAFDRAGYYDVITKQSGGRCASDKFAQELADQMNVADEFMFVPDDTGVYTDTAEMIHLIPECTNLSVGYFSQHGDRERQNITFLQAMAAQLALVRWDDLVVSRDPTPKKKLGAWADTYKTYTDSLDDRALFGSNVGALADVDMRVLEALENAIDGYITPLANLMCDQAANDFGIEPGDARAYMRDRLLDTVVLDDAYNELANGMDPELLLADLYEHCTHD
jgi:hypothetical protein